MLHCSTIGVHGGVSEIPADEDSAFAAGDIYQRTKLEGELRAQRAIEKGQAVTVVRPAGIYGPGDLRFLKLFTMVRSGRFVLFGSGDTFVHLVFVDDLLEGMIRAAEHPDTLGQTMILAGDRYVTIRELAGRVAESLGVRPPRWRLPLWPLMSAAALCEWVCRPIGVEPPLHRRRAAFFSKNRAFAIDRARRLIGYAPVVDLRQAVSSARRSGIAPRGCWDEAAGRIRPGRIARGAAMKVCLDVRVSTPGGTSTFIENFLRELDEIDTGHEIELLFSRDRQLLGREGCPGRSAPFGNRVLEFQWSQVALPHLLRREGVALYHSLKHLGPLRCPARSMYRVPAVGQFAGNYPMPFADHVYWSYLGRFVYRRADLLVAVSEYIRNGLVEYLGIPEDRVAVVHNGVDLRFRRLDPHERRADFLCAYSLEAPYLLCVGNLLPVKNLVTALSAYAVLADRIRDLPHLVLCGGQRHPHHLELRRQAGALGIADRVRFLDFQPPETLVELYNGAQLLLHPSLHEGFSFTILEAMACGLPIVASSNTSIPEAAGDAALYAEDPRNAEEFAALLEAVLDDEDLCAELSKRALSRVREFSWQRCVRDTVALYDRLT